MFKRKNKKSTHRHTGTGPKSMEKKSLENG
jgi:hypothetical protein